MEQLDQDRVESDQRRVVIISQDSFYRELSPGEAEDAKVGNFNFDHPGDFLLSICFNNSLQFQLSRGTFTETLATQATWLAQLGECRSAEWEVMGSNPGWTNTQGL